MKTLQKTLPDGRQAKISVVMSVYNGMPYLEEAVKSILNQTYRNFEFIIIDDASTDSSWGYLKSLKDRRIKLIKNEKNLGLASSLNKGIKAARGDYVARMDADDISLPQRFEKQINFFKAHKDYILVGSQVIWVDKNNNLISGFDTPLKDEDIRKKLIIRNQFHHATVMFRRSDIEKLGAYRDNLNGIEDYDLWFRVIKKGKVANLPERLVKRKIHERALTQKNHLKTELLAIGIRIINLLKFT